MIGSYRHLLTAIAALCVCAPLHAQDPATQNLAETLGFERRLPNGQPDGWMVSSTDAVVLDGSEVASGRYAARISQEATSGGRNVTLQIPNIPVNVAGEFVTLRGSLKLDELEGFATLFFTLADDTGALAFATMEQQQIQGTRDWQPYDVELALDPRATRLNLGVALVGTGTLWADDLELLVDGIPFDQVTPIVAGPDVLSEDNEFDLGSNIEISDLTAEQIESLAVLGKLWGFLKYHHPDVVLGNRHWDYELFRVIPAVLDAANREELNAVLLAWARNLGEPERCDPCVDPPLRSHLVPRIEWISDTSSLGEDLSGYLSRVYDNRRQVNRQFYKDTVFDFSNELPYSELGFPDSGYRILALFRFWNIVEYWFPYRDLIDESWERVLRDSLPRFVASRDIESYDQEVLRLVARADDSHARIQAPPLRGLPPIGDCQLPVTFRFVENQLTVWAFAHATLGPASGLEVGDVVRSLDGRVVDNLIAQWSPLYGGSNEGSRLREISMRIGRGQCLPVPLELTRGGDALILMAERIPIESLEIVGRDGFDRAGDAFQLLTDDVAYLKLSSARTAEIPGYLESAVNARGLIVDIRNYPSEALVFALAGHFVKERTPFAGRTMPDLANPGAHLWIDPVLLQPIEPYYSGRVVILVNEITQSMAEYTAMALRSGQNSVIVGSTTAGANGNVAAIPMPGGLEASISAVGVHYPDQRSTQRSGVSVDIHVEPTVDGTRSHRDEVLERAVVEILGGEIREERLLEITRRV